MPHHVIWHVRADWSHAGATRTPVNVPTHVHMHETAYTHTGQTGCTLRPLRAFLGVSVGNPTDGTREPPAQKRVAKGHPSEEEGVWARDRVVQASVPTQRPWTTHVSEPCALPGPGVPSPPMGWDRPLLGPFQPEAETPVTGPCGPGTGHRACQVPTQGSHTAGLGAATATRP